MKGTWMRLSYTESNMFKEVAGLRELFAIEYIRLRHNNAANVRGTEATESNQVQRWLNLLLTTASFTLIRQRNYIVREDFILTPEFPPSPPLLYLIDFTRRFTFIFTFFHKRREKASHLSLPLGFQLIFILVQKLEGNRRPSMA
jgi:hypothetical protein